MKTKSLPFFATTLDIRSVLQDVERELAVRYVRVGDVEPSGEPLAWSTSADIPDLGVASEGDQALERALLVLPATEEPRTREVPLRRGGRRIVVDQTANAASVMLRAGGVLRSGVLIAGQVGTVSEDPWAVQAYGTIARIIRRVFQKTKSYYVGQEALQQLKSGARLTARVRSPREFDLVAE
ncbi:MAG: hypothetical protein H6837_07545 [Planctomycetes bacterium]|nr:hypothetical protein [Planctomycetota bacterium]